MAKRIPAKQVVRAGTESDLREKLIDRELGFNSEELVLYIKYGDDLIPAGAISIPSPGTNSVFKGSEDGSMDWAELPVTPAPYNEELQVYESLDGVPFGAAFAYKDSDGNDIHANVYYSPRVRERYGRLVIVNQENSHLATVSMGDSDSAWLGALMPTTAPSTDNQFKSGDILMVSSTYGDHGPMVNWVHPESDAVKNALPGKMLVATFGETTQAVINAAIQNRYIIVLEYFENGSTVPLYAYYSHSTDVGPVFRSTVYSNGTVKQFSVLYTDQWVEEVVPVNKVFVAIKDSTTYSELNTALANNQMLVLEYFNEGSDVPNYAYFYGSTDAGVTFHTLPDSGGNYKTFTLLYTNQWFVSDECVCKVFVATYGVTSAQEIRAAVDGGKVVLLQGLTVGTIHIDFILTELVDGANPTYLFCSPINRLGTYYWASLDGSTWTNGSKSVAVSAENTTGSYVNWGNGTSNSMGTYKSLMSVSVPAGKTLELTVNGTVQYDSGNASVGSWSGLVLQVAESDAYASTPTDSRYFYVRSFVNGRANEATVAATFLIPASSSAKTYYLGAYNLYGVSPTESLLLASNISANVGVKCVTKMW